jgi:hypothetical protein
MNRKYLFVSGCPRSGTTVLAHILNWSNDVFVGQERYGELLNKRPVSFTPGLFEAERLRRFEAGECGYASYEANGEYNAWYANNKLGVDFAAMKHVGDKIPELYKRFEVFSSPAWAGRDVTLLHIVRNVFDVAGSYQTRKLDTADGWQKDYLLAIADWSASVRRAHEQMSNPQPNVRLGIVDYDSLFAGGADELVEASRKIFGFAGIAFGEAEKAGVLTIQRAAETRKKMRQNHDAIRADVLSRVDPEVARMHEALKARSIC